MTSDVTPEQSHIAGYITFCHTHTTPLQLSGCDCWGRKHSAEPNIDRLLTGVADYLYFRDRQMSVLSITLFHAAVLRCFFRVFLHVVHFCIRDNSGCSHRMTHMLGESHSAAPHLPGASVISSEQELFGAITF